MRRTAMIAALAAGACTQLGLDGDGSVEATAQPANAHADHVWSYAGETAPAHWGALSAENAVCARGVQQSPVDLAASVPALAVAPPPEWAPVRPTSVINNGHTIQVNVEDAGGIMRGGEFYELKQFHFHHASEHTLDGRAFPLEVHFVHQSEAGGLAVVGVFLEDGGDSELLGQLWSVATAEEGEAHLDAMIDPASLLPAETAAYHYAGSLTTPPCSEIVAWTVYATPTAVSTPQIEAFANVFENNARPTQELNRRFVLATR